MDGMERGRRIVAALLAAVGLASGALAQHGPNLNVQVNYVYATQFGFGAYNIGGLRVNVYSLPLSYTFKDVWRDWDLTLRAPITFGNYRFAATYMEDGERVAVNAHTNTIAVEPLLRLDVPLFEGFRLSPLGAWGLGSSFDSGGKLRAGGQTINLNSSESAFYTYQMGVTSLYERPWRTFKLLFGAALIWAGDEYFDDKADLESYGTFRTGVEARHPLGFAIAGRLPDAGLAFIYDHFFPGLEFTRVQRAALEVSDLFQVALTVGAASPLELPVIGDMLDDLRLGVAYQAGDGLDAVKLTTGFPF